MFPVAEVELKMLKRHLEKISSYPKLISKRLESMALASLYSGLKSPIPNEYNIGHLLNSLTNWLLTPHDGLVLHINDEISAYALFSFSLSMVTVEHTALLSKS